MKLITQENQNKKTSNVPYYAIFIQFKLLIEIAFKLNFFYSLQIFPLSAFYLRIQFLIVPCFLLLQNTFVLYARKTLSTYSLCEESTYMEDAFVYIYTSFMFGITLGCEIIENLFGFSILFDNDGTHQATIGSCIQATRNASSKYLITEV